MDSLKIELTLSTTLEAAQAEAKAEFTGDPKNADKKARSNGAKAFIRGLLEQFPDGDVKKALGIIAADMSAGGFTFTRNRTGGKDVVLALLEKEGGRVSKGLVFEQLDKGPAEMRDAIRDLIRKAKTPADRVWVQFDGKDYVLVGRGAEPPKDWKGPLPLEA